MTRPIARRRQGLATLAIVLVLFFVMALVAAYTNRNLVFEQRIAATSYRAERALAAADAGVEWAVAALNAGRLDNQCRPSSDAGDATFRDRYLSVGSNGLINRVSRSSGALNWFDLGCVLHAAGVSCSCPSAAEPTPTPNPAQSWSGGDAAAFRVEVLSLDTLTGWATPKSGVLMVTLRGCGSPGTSTAEQGVSCINDAGGRPQVDGVAYARAWLALVPALPAPPVAAVTAYGALSGAGRSLTLSNPDGATALALHTGGGATYDAATSTFAGPAGAGQSALQTNDTALQAPASSDRMTDADAAFARLFGMTPDAYRKQPAVVRIDCASACSETELNGALTAFPGRAIWFDGDLTLSSAPTGGAWGTASDPLLVIATGTLTLNAPAVYRGVLFAPNVVWGAATGRVEGALVGYDVTVSAALRALYDEAIVTRIRTAYGTYVRAPGGYIARGQ